jgi:hypothetical protein
VSVATHSEGTPLSNTQTGLFQTLVAASTAAANNLQYANSFVDAIYWEHKPVVATPATTLNVIIPTVDETTVTDIGSGALAPTDAVHNSVQVPYDKHFSTSFIIPAWDQARTPQDLERTYIRPRFEALLRKVNRTIATLFSTTNFGTGATPVAGYALATGGTAGHFVRSDINTCWQNMVNEGVPMEDESNLFFLTSPTAYAGMLGDQTMTNQYIVGTDSAVQAQQRAKLALIFNASPRYDQHFSLISTSLGFTATKQPGVLMHRYAVSAVTAQPAPTDPNQAAVQEQIIWLKDVLPVQVQMGYSLKDQGTIVNIHAFWGCAVSRADYASLIQTA